MDHEFCLSFLGIEQANYVSNFTHFLSSVHNENRLNGVQIWRDPGLLCSVVDGAINQMQGVSFPVLDLIPVIHQIRVLKSKAEQELMRRSCSIASSSMLETMKVDNVYNKLFFKNHILPFLKFRLLNQISVNLSYGLQWNTIAG